jgi:hypothetical protein
MVDSVQQTCFAFLVPKARGRLSTEQWLNTEATPRRFDLRDMLEQRVLRGDDVHRLCARINAIRAANRWFIERAFPHSSDKRRRTQLLVNLKLSNNTDDDDDDASGCAVHSDDWLREYMRERRWMATIVVDAIADLGVTQPLPMEPPSLLSTIFVRYFSGFGNTATANNMSNEDYVDETRFIAAEQLWNFAAATATAAGVNVVSDTSQNGRTDETSALAV